MAVVAVAVATVAAAVHQRQPIGVVLSEEVALTELTWQTLSDVEFKDVYLEELDAYYWMPNFGSKVIEAEGKEC